MLVHRSYWLIILSLLTVSLLAGCAGQSPSGRPTASSSAPSALTLAVWDFDNNSMAGGELDYLQKALSEMLLTDLAKASGIRLVERVNLRAALEEQHLSTSQLSSEESRLKLGRIAGANHMAFGSFMAMGKQIRIDVRIVEVETSLVKYSESVTATSTDTAKQMQVLAQRIAQNWAGTNSSANSGNTDIATWQRYEQGVNLMDQKRYDEAINLFKDILKNNPDFSAAEKQIRLALEQQQRQ